MANAFSPKYSSIARPYARAAFECARAENNLPAWKTFFAAASFAAQQANFMTLASAPEMSAPHLFELCEQALPLDLNAKQKNFLLLLAQNKRVLLLPEIAGLFDMYYAHLEKQSVARVITATPLKDDIRQKLVASLTKRMHRDVAIENEVDPSIIGGAIIHFGDSDRVIDDSIRGKLTRLLANLTA